MAHASGWRKRGSLSIGKNVPLNRKSGVMPNRNSMLKGWSLFCVAVKAIIGAAKAIPVSIATGMARTASGEVTAPSTRMARKKRTESRVSRKTIHSRSPTSRSRALNGVLRAARYVFSQTILPMIGQADSNEAAIMAWVTSNAGAMKLRYGTPPGVPPLRST